MWDSEEFSLAAQINAGLKVQGTKFEGMKHSEIVGQKNKDTVDCNNFANIKGLTLKAWVFKRLAWEKKIGKKRTYLDYHSFCPSDVKMGQILA
jgi:hypothetical protein